MTAITATLIANAQHAPTSDPPQYGPYNAVFLADGSGLRSPLANSHDTVLLPESPWSLSCWFKAAEPASAMQLLAGVGDVTAEYPRYLALAPGRVGLWAGTGNELFAPADLAPGGWHLLTATFDRTQFHVYLDGRPAAAGPLALGTPTPILQMAPPVIAPMQATHFGGELASFILLRRALNDAEVAQMQQTPPPFAALAYDEGSKPWPFQTRGQAGYRAPQDPAQLPSSRAPLGLPVLKQRPPLGPSLTSTAAGEWTFSDGWTLREAPLVRAEAGNIASAAFSDRGWMRATVPGTVLTTMVDDGVYPDPDYGLNNLAIPETLNKQDYWYRNTFTVPDEMRSALAGAGGNVELAFQGINYRAEIWLNGSRLGTIKGAFRRGTFDVTQMLTPGRQNVLAVRISPPTHPGIPQEQSILGGPGENGGAMELDGPTFLATEGWDWIPAIRDRDTGIWQPVTLTVRNVVKLGDIVAHPLFTRHDMSRAAVELEVPVTNTSGHPLDLTLDAAFDTVSVHKQVRVEAGSSVIKLTPAEFPQLIVPHPHLWWPNGYGKPELYTLKIEAHVQGRLSDHRELRFGMREISYELSLLDATGHVRRVEFTPAASLGATQSIVNVSHQGMREIPSADAVALDVPEDRRGDQRYKTAISSLPKTAEGSPAIERIAGGGPDPYLVLKVNGVRIAARGGNWGMDDARKRVSREHLEPFFRLNRDAHLNIIRNWVGLSTEETFYELADEYGMMIWNDFWESTQNYNLEAEDPALFLDNAHDTIMHFRNHPSIVLWCGRNEGVPQPIINEGLEELVRTLDGTRFYSPSSNEVNLQHSGPYTYQDPKQYYTALNRGFSVETGTQSMSTLESFESTTPKADQWPVDDVWAYHDWHASGNGATAPFMAELEAEFGAATSLNDFERKAQMLNYVSHRAIFEGMNANLWTPNSGRLLWMTQPAWPSTMWQILSSDYDTQASFYGTMKGSEPVHIQLNLNNYQIDVTNTTVEPRSGMTATAQVYTLDGALLSENKQPVSANADALVHTMSLALRPMLEKGMVLVKLQLADSAGKELSRNLYWLGGNSAAYRELNHLTPVALTASAKASSSDTEMVISVKLTNNSKVASLANKLTLMSPDNDRILPAYYTDNYISLLPGESQVVEVRFPARSGRRKAEIAMRGWNAVPQAIPVDLPR